MRISEVVAGKASQVIVTITPDATVRELVALLAQHNIGAAVVSSDGTTVAGIVSERDIVRRLTGDDGALSATVSEIMTADVRTCEPGSSLDEVRTIMTDGRFRHLPVVEDGRLVGVVSIGDIVKNHIDQVEFERDQLDSYVHQT
ncbi:CBS domain-containing protein [Nocardioides marmoriginsengisoli]|uniref:CBS domain-containing protein n=1 Tax=Nocardioides marmoriginsengisoli TaxID=661483 RepID=A0A3N0CPN8_9ACTN|nr:CBS domain-containing protein [Nocardioides marmoriginsengisoli]RNL65299.1 CBS domain-containing protein [Nocardioides marmoriginsengisoli]